MIASLLHFVADFHVKIWPAPPEKPEKSVKIGFSRYPISCSPRVKFAAVFRVFNEKASFSVLKSQYKPASKLALYHDIAILYPEGRIIAIAASLGCWQEG